MPAIRERWFADGWEFTEGNIRDVEYRSGQLGTPAKRGSNAVVNNRAGEVWRPKKDGPGTFTLEVWLGTYQRQAQQLWDELLRAVTPGHRLVTWRRVTADGENRTCLGEVTGSLQPTAIAQAGYRASIEVTVPGSYWRGDQLLSVSSPTTGPATSRELDLSVFSRSTAPLTELRLRLAGDLLNPRLADTTIFGTGDSVLYAGAIPNKQALILNCGDWTATTEGGLVYVGQALNYSGDRFLQLAPTPPGVKHALRLTAERIGAGAGVTVSGYPSYLC